MRQASSAARPSPSLNDSVAGSTPWPWRARTQPFFEKITVNASSSTGVSSTAFSDSSITVRRLSPNALMSASISSITSASSVLRLPSTFSRPFCSFARPSSSFSSLMCSSLANWRRRISRMSSACLSVSLNARIRSGLGSSELRISLITLSTLSSTSRRPSSTWMRSSTLSRRNLERRVTVAKRNSSHSARMSFRFLPVGRPSSPTITRLIEALVSMLVFASSRLMNSFSSWREDLGSNTRRTGWLRSDSSRARSSMDSISCFSRCCSGVSDFFPGRGCGLVMASISSSTLREDAPGGSSCTTTCHCPRARRSMLQRARTRTAPRPLA